MKYENYRNQKGITLIALVVTIIIIMLLAGIAISSLSGDNSLLNKAKQSIDVTDIEAAREIVALAVQSVQAETYVKDMDKNDIRDELEKEIKLSAKNDEEKENTKVTTVEDIYRVEFRKYIFNVSDEFRIVEYVQDFNSEEWDEEKTPEAAFIWASENPNDGEDYHTIIGYNKDMVNYTILRIPSRCHVIDIQYKNKKDYGRENNYSESINRSISRTFESIYSYGFAANLPNGGITKIEIPATVTKLSGAFVGFSTITEVELPYSLKEITDSSFYGCTGLTKITIPSSVTKIGNASFYNCTNLEDVFIPNTVTIIGKDVFLNTKFYDNLPDGEIYFGKVFYKYKGITPSSITIKEGTTAIAGNAFSNICKTSWGYNTQENTTLASVYIPDSVTYIGGSAFYNCKNLSKCDMPSNINYIGGGSFCYTAIKELAIQNDIDYIGNEAFSNCSNLSDINITGKIGKIEMGAFSNTKWINSEPTGAVYINNILYTYKSTGSSNVTLEVADGTTEIADYAISYKNEISTIKLPSTMKRIGDNALTGCQNLTNIELNEGLEDIGAWALAYCSSLNSITLPSTLKYIRNGAFCNCSNIEFGDLVIPEGVEIIGGSAFNSCTGIKTLKTPTTLKMLYHDAFNNCTNMENAELSEGLRIITDGAFYACNSLTTIKIPSTVYFMGEDVFKKCFELAFININQEKDSLENAPWDAPLDPLVIWKGQKLDEYTIKVEDDNVIAISKAYVNQKVILSSSDTTKQVVGFEVNGKAQTGSYFYMPAENVTITNVIYDDQRLLESDHPYELNQENIYEAKFEEKTAIKLEFDNRTQLDWSSNIYLYDTNDVLIRKFGGEELAGKTLYINDNGVKLKFVTGSGTRYYGFKCIVTRTNEIGYRLTEIPGGYKDNCIYALTASVDSASKVQVTFDEQSNIASDDKLYIYTNDATSISQNTTTRATLYKDNIASRIFAMEGNAIVVLLESKTGQKTAEGIKYIFSAYETPDNVLESPHNYYNNMRTNYEKTLSGAEVLKLTFDKETYVENNCDRIYIYDKNNYVVAQYTGTELANQTVYVTGEYVRIYMYTDSSVIGYGFRCTVEDATDELEKIEKEVTLESDHPYENNIDLYYTANIEGATLLKLEFDSNTVVENSFDKIYIYNSNGVQVGYYTNSALAGQTITLAGNSVKVRLKTDSSVTKYGFKCKVTGYKIKTSS